MEGELEEAGPVDAAGAGAPSMPGPGASTGRTPEGAGDTPSRGIRSLEAVTAALAVVLLGWLFTPCLRSGDAAAYVEEAMALRGGGPLLRPLHAGYVAALAAVSPAGPGADAAANALSAGLAAIALASARSTASSLGAGRVAALVPVWFLLGASPFLDSALFAEVYGPAAAALLASAALGLSGRTWAVPVLAGWAVTVNPGAAAWIPTLSLLAARGGIRRSVTGALCVLPAAALGALWVDGWLAGPRGALAAWDGDVGPVLSLQRAWRLGIEAAPATLPLLAMGGLTGPRGRAYALAWLPGFALTCAAVDRRGDVPAHLASLVLLAPLAGLGAEAVARAFAHRRRGTFPAAVGVAMLLAFQVGEGTSRHDRLRRRAARAAGACAALGELDPPPLPVGPWGAVRLCRHQAPGLPRGGGDGVANPHRVIVPPGRAPTAAEARDAAPRMYRPIRLSRDDVWMTTPGGVEPNKKPTGPAPEEDPDR